MGRTFITRLKDLESWCSMRWEDKERVKLPSNTVDRRSKYTEVCFGLTAALHPRLFNPWSALHKNSTVQWSTRWMTTMRK